MSTIACPGCGMPRAAELVDVAPCPVCGHTPADALELPGEPEPVAAEAAAPPPVARAPGSPKTRFGVGVTLGFVLGALAGVGGVFAAQANWRPAPRDAGDAAAAAQPEPAPTPAPAQPSPVSAAVPGLSHSSYTPANPSVGVPKANESDTAGFPKPLGTVPVPPPEVEQPGQLHVPPMLVPVPQQPPPPGVPTVITVNEPDGVYTLPFPVQNREQVILKGKAKGLRLPAVGGGATVDASALDAREITVGPVGGGAVVKLNAPEGSVRFTGRLDGKAVVEVNAAGGEVVFPAPPAGPEGAAVDGGTKLVVTAKRVSIRGDVAGAGTHVHVTLTRAGALHVGVVQGAAVVEYRSATGGWSYSTVTVGPVAPTATVRELGPKRAAVADDD